MNWLHSLIYSILAVLVLGFQILCGEPTTTPDSSFQNKLFIEKERAASNLIKQEPGSLRGWSSRGDMRLFLGNFEGAKADYEKMVELDPKVEVSHWRLGIAYFYLEEFEKAARQFEIYHNYDAVDRENGIWRFMSQYRSDGLGTARKGLLNYEKDDRPPYPLLYEMFAGRMDPESLLSSVEKSNYPPRYKKRVLFHAHLYVGIYMEMVEKKADRAFILLKKAFENEYGRTTGTYMWQVARIHYMQMCKKRIKSLEGTPLREK